MNRRRFLQLSALCAAAGVASPGSGAPAYSPPELLHLLGPESVRRLGRHYREMVPGAELLAAEPHRRRSGGPVRDDFAAGRTVVVLGWVLSVTEARQCALFSLLPA